MRLHISERRGYALWNFLICTCIIIGFGEFTSGCVRQIHQGGKNVSDNFIEISIEGGGFYGGINPTTQNKKIVKSNGEIIVLQKSLYADSTAYTYFVSRGEVEQLAGFISAKGFFNMADVYDCGAANQKCRDRKKQYPPAIPVRIHATMGELHKTVTVTVYEENMVEYPAEFDDILKKINEIIDSAKK